MRIHYGSCGSKVLRKQTSEQRANVRVNHDLQAPFSSRKYYHPPPSIESVRAECSGSRDHSITCALLVSRQNRCRRAIIILLRRHYVQRSNNFILLLRFLFRSVAKAKAKAQGAHYRDVPKVKPFTGWNNLDNGKTN